jgi:hypothetical protein
MFEPTRDNYDFTVIDDLLARAAACNKRIILLMNIENYSSTIPWNPGGVQGFPQYLVSSEFGPCCSDQLFNVWELGGLSAPVDGSGGYGRGNVNLWTPNVMDRYIALANALGAHLDGVANFEGISFIGETAIATNLVDYPAFVTQTLRLMQAAATAFPHTWSRIGTNYTDTDTSMQTIIEACAALPNCILGGPDPLYAAVQVGVRPPGWDQAPEVYNGNQCDGCTMKDYRSLVGWITETQFDMLQTGYPPYIGGAGPPPDGCDEDVNVIRTYSEGPGLNSKYLIFTKSSDCYDPDGAQTGVIDSINTTPGITSTTCPGNFANLGGGCNRN